MKKLVVIFLLALSLQGMAQEVRDFSLTNASNGQAVALADYKSGSGVVIIFTLNSCPFDAYYAERIKSLSLQNVPIILINSSPDDIESLENMKKYAARLGLTVPYLADKDQSVMLDLNARKSTEAFLLKNNGGKFSVFYHGAIDDNPQVAADTKHNYLKDAIAKMQAGEASYGIDARPAGCSIRRK